MWCPPAPTPALPKPQSLENRYFPAWVLSGEPGGQPACNPCPLVLGHVNLTYSALFLPQEYWSTVRK